MANMASIHGQHVTHSKPKAKRAFTNFEGPFFPGILLAGEITHIWPQTRKRRQLSNSPIYHGHHGQKQNRSESINICHLPVTYMLRTSADNVGCCRPFACNRSEEDVLQRPLPSRRFGSCSLSSPVEIDVVLSFMDL